MIEINPKLLLASSRPKRSGCVGLAKAHTARNTLNSFVFGLEKAFTKKINVAPSREGQLNIYKKTQSFNFQKEIEALKVIYCLLYTLSKHLLKDFKNAEYS